MSVMCVKSLFIYICDVGQILFYLYLSVASYVILFMSVMCVISYIIYVFHVRQILFYIYLSCASILFLFISDMCIISYIIYVSHMRQFLYYFYLSCASILKACRLYHEYLLLQKINEVIIHVLKNFFSASDIMEAVRGRFCLYCMNVFFRLFRESQMYWPSSKYLYLKPVDFIMKIYFYKRLMT